ncbi:Uma2 family endonuclease [Dyadobacter sp. CY323]|uniref:Uma2 family endonuclease n=1 Tax=Dyadobacter sp. CY323 TaxID=2907302 RepID=UPI001F21D982|nr:Uma2 family endonuclease [Dyadobacter sp. CY323]MCE6991677.1 Uma2 family endonuclease [Dyadobacter sp. CY323]
MEAGIFYNPDLTQIINGREILSPGPKVSHQRILVKVLRILDDFVQAKELGEIFRVPLDVIFEENFNILQPDLMFISKARENIIQDWIRGVPDLVIEIVSPESNEMDTVVKKEIYQRYGVSEFWLIFPEKALLEVYELRENKFHLCGVYHAEDQVKSPVLPGLTFTLGSILPAQ